MRVPILTYPETIADAVESDLRELSAVNSIPMGVGTAWLDSWPGFSGLQ